MYKIEIAAAQGEAESSSIQAVDELGAVENATDATQGGDVQNQEQVGSVQQENENGDEYYAVLEDQRDEESGNHNLA